MTDFTYTTMKSEIEEVIRIDDQGFHYRGQFIEDAGEAHRLLVQFLRQQLPNQQWSNSMTDPMDDLRQASADVTGVEVLSPAAQAVWDAAWQLSPVNCKSHEDRRRQQIAAALRAATDLVVPEPSDLDKEMFSIAALRLRWVIRDQLLAIATELENAQ